METTTEKTPAEALEDRLDEITWRAITALSSVRLIAERSGESFVIVAKIAKGSIAAKAVPGSWETFTVDAHGAELHIDRACEFCAKTATARITLAGGQKVLVCGRCSGSAEAEALSYP